MAAKKPVIPHKVGRSNAQDLAAYNRSKARSALAKDPKPKATPPPAAAAPSPQTEQYNGVMSQANDAQSGLLNQVQNQQPFNPETMGVKEFNPGDFQQTFQGAYDNALNQFNRSSEPAFTKQKQDFEQMIAERGIDPTSQQYKEMYKAQISDPQETARLNAQDAAYQTGMSAQNQAYNQAAGTYGQNLSGQSQQFGQAQTRYQMPYQNLNALSPYLQAQYGQQMAQQQQGYTQQNAALEQDYAKELAALQQKYTMQNNRFVAANQKGGSGGGGGGMTLQDQIALQNNQLYNNLVLGGAMGQQQQPSTTNSALTGFASGVGAGLTANLAR